jgi:hypothetical protein
MPTLWVLAMTLEDYKLKAGELGVSRGQFESGFSNVSYSTFTESDYVDSEVGMRAYKPPITEDLSRFAAMTRRDTQERAKRWWGGLSVEEKTREIAKRQANGRQMVKGTRKVHYVSRVDS